MDGPDGLGAALLVADVELRRSWRRLVRDSPYRWLKLVVGILFLGGYALSAGVAGFAVATFVREGVAQLGDAGLLGIARSVIAGFTGMLVFFALQRTIKGKGVPDGRSILLTSTTHRPVALGLLLAETVRIVLVALAPILAFAAGVTIGFAEPLVFPVLAATLVAVLIAAVSVGFVLGLAVKNVAARSSTISRHRLATNLLTSLVVLGGYLLVLADPSRLGQFNEFLRDHPLGWPADLALLIGPVAVRPDRALIAGLGLLAIPMLVIGLTSALGGWLYYADPLPSEPSTSAESEKQRSHVKRAIHRLASPIGRPTRSVVRKNLKRLRRAPHIAQYAILPLFFLFYEAQVFAVSGTVPPRLPAVFGVAAAWATGAVFSLNPLGNEEPVLPITLTTGVSGRAFVGGLALAGAAIGLPVGIAAVTAAQLAVNLDFATFVAVLLATILLCVSTPGIGAAMGVRFPKRQPTAIGRDREIVLPSPWAFFGYSVGVLLLGGPMIAGTVMAVRPMVGSLGLDVGTLPMIGAAVTIVLAAVVGSLAYRDATRRVQTYRLD